MGSFHWTEQWCALHDSGLTWWKVSIFGASWRVGRAVELKQTPECVWHLIYLSWALARNKKMKKKNKNRNGNELLPVAVRSVHVLSVTFLTPFFFSAAIKLDSSSFCCALCVERFVSMRPRTVAVFQFDGTHRYAASCIFIQASTRIKTTLCSVLHLITFERHGDVLLFHFIYLWPRAIACVMTSTNEIEYVCTALYVHTNEIRLE